MRCGPISGRGSATKVMYVKPPTQPFLTWSGLPAIRPRLDGIFWRSRLRSKLLDSRGELRTFRRILPAPTTRRSKPWPTSVSHVHKCPGTTSAARRFLRALRLQRVSACSPRLFSNSDLGARPSSSNRLARVGGTVSNTRVNAPVRPVTACNLCKRRARTARALRATLGRRVAGQVIE